MSEHTEPELDHDDARDAAVASYWATARKRAGLNRLDVVVGQQALGAVQPPAWSFGSGSEEADSLLDLVLAGRKTATASAESPYSAQGVPVPVPGDLSIILDGAGRPRALIVTTEVEVRPFREVDAEHAAAEGEGDLSLEHWRTVHEPFFAAELAEAGLPFDADVPVVLERFKLLDPKPRRHHEDVREPVTT
ncbi:ASCH domain-containing protein [Georgenia sp. 311]|uniref:ASCH domain-containing protein n=1 Tax=Georgenia sp. 311 TaxID=2585134 RepID=UPI001112577C|nr:ASCH domain-containing protein [Georgenia sp. 311]TNC18567.1 ASCH domain-containing protein [Georgenia sp. 311]